MYEGETVVCVCATVVCEEVVKFLRMSVNKLCKKVACKRVVYARVACATVVCEKADLPSDAVESRAGRSTVAWT